MWYPTKQGRVVSITNQLILKQSWKVSNVQQEQQWTNGLPCGTPDTTSKLEHHTPSTLPLCVRLDKKFWNTFKIKPPTPASRNLNTKPPMINPVKGRTEINLDERELSTPVKFQLTSTDDVKKSITGTQSLPV